MNSDAAITPLAISFFGTFEIIVAGAPLPRLRTRKGQWLLALLILRQGRAVERSYLAGVLWPESDESKALANLRLSLTDLRHALGAAASRLHAPTAHTLAFDLTGATVDVFAFDADIASDAADRMQNALALYRGSLLEDCTEDWAAQDRTAREQAYLSALQTLAERALAASAPEKAVAYLRKLVLVDPLRESAWRSLMQALADAGDYAALTQTYRDFRLYLHSEFNCLPAPETTALYQKLKNTRSDPAPRAPLVQASSVGGYVPSPLTALVGRRQEVQDAAHRLRLSRLVTLTGTGGVGKTRLALALAGEVGDDFPQGVYFVDLAPLSSPAFVPQAVASTLKLPEAPGQSLTDTLVQSLRDQRLLLVLDNCEHLLTACAALTDKLLSGCSQLRILATSRQPLGLTGEVILRVPSLSLPAQEISASEEKDVTFLLEYEAVRLFVARAQDASPPFRLHRGNQRAVVEICRRVSGIPLAIELAAVRVRSMAVEQIAARLEDRFDLLQGGNAGVLPRHKTLRATLDWSYDLLSPEEQTLLRRLSVFAGGCTLEAAEAVCADDTP